MSENSKDWIHVLLIPFIYPLALTIVGIIVTGIIYQIGPFAPPGEKISYNIEKYINEPDGSYMKGICIWNSGSKDIPSLNLTFHFENYKSVDVLDKEFNIIDRLINASPQFAKNRAGSVPKFL